MSNPDHSPDLFSTRLELDEGVRALDEGDFAHAHAILLAMFISPDIPHWFRKLFCTAPLREAARSYLPTRAALRRMRQRAENRLLGGDHNPLLLQRALMLDDALDDMPARFRLLRQLDAVAGGLLVSCRGTATAAFAEHADMQRARKYLGDYRDALASLSGLQDMGWLYSKGDGWAEGAALANASHYVCRLGMIATILRSNGEHEAAGSVEARSARLIFNAKFRKLVAREQRDPGFCLRELRKWYVQPAPAARTQRFEGRHSHPLPRPQGGSNAIA